MNLWPYIYFVILLINKLRWAMDTFLNMTKAMADGSRVRVLVALLRHEEMCVCQIVELLGLAIPTVSRHMSILQGARLVRSRKEWRWVYYRLSEQFPRQIHEWVLESLSGSTEIDADRILLETILSRTPEETCRQQQERNLENTENTSGLRYGRKGGHEFNAWKALPAQQVRFR
jgi:ArsR family transcriptional regulator, arsenate/arsenite/antimonite-responsive transcriptional repressor